MSLELILVLVFVVTTLIGYKLIKNVPSLLHTPLMSGMNALSGITILATMTATAYAVTTGSKIFGCIGIITDRMLKMFKTGNESKEDTK